MYYELVIFTDVLFATLHLTSEICGIYTQTLNNLSARADGRN